MVKSHFAGQPFISVASENGLSKGLVPLCLHPMLPAAYKIIIRVLNWGLIA